MLSDKLFNKYIKKNDSNLYMLKFLLQGFSIKDSWSLWKYETKVFRPKTYAFCKIIKLSFSLFKARISLFFDKYRK